MNETEVYLPKNWITVQRKCETRSTPWRWNRKCGTDDRRAALVERAVWWGYKSLCINGTVTHELNRTNYEAWREFTIWLVVPISASLIEASLSEQYMADEKADILENLIFDIRSFHQVGGDFYPKLVPYQKLPPNWWWFLSQNGGSIFFVMTWIFACIFFITGSYKTRQRSMENRGGLVFRRSKIRHV